VDISDAVTAFTPGWTISHCGRDMNPGLRGNWGGRKRVLVTHPLSQQQPCILRRRLDVPADQTTALELVVGHDPRGDWTLVATGNGKILARERIGKTTCTDGWRTVRVDLSPFAGTTVQLSLENRADGWSWEAGYWAEISISSR
jgi:hypothetical protein